MRVREYEDGDEILQEGSVGYQFFIIKEGTVSVEKDGKHVRNMDKLDYFGHRSLLDGTPISKTIKAEGPVSCWILNKQDFSEIIQERSIEMIRKRMYFEDLKLDISEVHVVKMIGKG